MGRVRGRGNRSTEQVVAAFLRERAITGWETHSAGVLGSPDFYFPAIKLAVFVDGCFWHGCPICRRNTPTTRTEFWRAKIAANRRRDRTVTTGLRASGIHVTRIWEHALKGPRWGSALLSAVTRATRAEARAGEGAAGQDHTLS